MRLDKSFFEQEGERKCLSIKGKKMSIDKELLEILVCPKCKGDIQLTPHEDGLICKHCGLKYPIRDDIPVMLIDEAIKLENLEDRGN